LAIDVLYVADSRPALHRNLHDAGFSLGWVSALDREGQTIWIVDAHGYGKRFIVRADDIPTAFLALERSIHEFALV